MFEWTRATKYYDRCGLYNEQDDVVAVLEWVDDGVTAKVVDTELFFKQTGVVRTNLTVYDRASMEIIAVYKAGLGGHGRLKITEQNLDFLWRQSGRYHWQWQNLQEEALLNFEVIPNSTEKEGQVEIVEGFENEPQSSLLLLLGWYMVLLTRGVGQNALMPNTATPGDPGNWFRRYP